MFFDITHVNDGRGCDYVPPFKRRKDGEIDVQIRLEYLIETLNVADSLQRKI